MAIAVPVLSPTGIVNLFFLVLGIEVFVTGLVPQSSHDICFSQYRLVDKRIVDFFKRTPAAEGQLRQGLFPARAC